MSGEFSSENPSDYLTSYDDSERQRVYLNPRRTQKCKIKKRPHIVKSENQYNLLMRLYLKREFWSVKFIEQVAIKLKLSTSQVYKWCWDRREQEKRQRLLLEHTDVLPNKIWYVTRVSRKVEWKRIKKCNM